MAEEQTIINDELASKIVRYYGYTEEISLKNAAKTSAKLMVGEYFDGICTGTCGKIDEEQMRECVVEELNRRFDEKVLPAVEQTYPHLDDDELDAKLAAIEKLYQKEHEKQVNAVTKAALKEFKTLRSKLERDIQQLKKKYAS